MPARLIRDMMLERRGYQLQEILASIVEVMDLICERLNSCDLLY